LFSFIEKMCGEEIDELVCASVLEQDLTRLKKGHWQLLWEEQRYESIFIVFDAFSVCL